MNKDQEAIGVDFKTYQPGNEEDIVTLWNHVLHEDPIQPQRFRNLVLLDANFDPTGMQLAWDGPQLVGCLYAVRRRLPMIADDLEPDHGWIPFFFVRPAYSGQGVATQLLQKALMFLRGCGRKRVFFASYAPNFIVPGIDRIAYPSGAGFLEANGFAVQYTASAMDLCLVGFRSPDDVARHVEERHEEGYSFRLAQTKDLYPTIQLANEHFNPDWGRAIREGVLRNLPPDHISIAERSGEILGFAMFGGYEGVPDRFGPFGVRADQRGKQLGKILLCHCLENMKAKGVHSAWFLWTGETSPAGHLYKRVGFQVTRRFDVMVKDL